MKRWKPWALPGFILILACRAHAAGGLSLNGGSVIVTGPAALDTTGDITLTTGTLLSIGKAQFHVGGNWNQSGAGRFAADHSTVFLTGDSSLSGTNSFYNLATTTPGQTLTLQAGFNQTVAQTLTLAGSAETLSRIRSSLPGSFAGLVNLASNSVDDVEVQDINAFGGAVINAGPRSILTHTINWSYGALLLTPQPVTRVTGQSNTLSWAAVTTYTDGSSVASGIGTTYEITQYPDLSDTADGMLVASGLVPTTYGPLEPLAGSPLFYGISAVINNVKSVPFYADNNPAPNYAYAADNGMGYVLVPPALQGPFSGTGSPYFFLKVITQIVPAGAGVLASASLQIQLRGSGSVPVDYHFLPPGAVLVLRGTQAPSPAQDAYPVQMNADGAWKTVGTARYSAPNNTYAFTVYQTGLYRVGAAAGSGLSSVLQSVHPRLFSPNGDGYNDVVRFDLINPDQESVKGEIFDLHAAKVADLEPSSLGLQWDGRGPGSRIVPGGIYIYQIYVGHTRANGAVVVIK